MLLTDLAPQLDMPQLAYLRLRLRSAVQACYLAAADADFWDARALEATGDEIEDVIA